MDLVKLERFAMHLEAARRAELARRYPNLEASKIQVRIILGRKYAKVDVGDSQWSGAYMVDDDGQIFGIKAYGKVHKGHRYGTLDDVGGWNWGPYYAIKAPAPASAPDQWYFSHFLEERSRIAVGPRLIVIFDLATKAAGIECPMCKHNGMFYEGLSSDGPVGVFRCRLCGMGFNHD